MKAKKKHNIKNSLARARLYAEKAMPFLRFETATPSETDKIIQAQAEEIEVLRKSVEQVKEIRRLEDENRRLADETIKLTLKGFPILLKYVEKDSKDEEALKTVRELRKRLLQLDKAYEKLKSNPET